MRWKSSQEISGYRNHRVTFWISRSNWSDLWMADNKKASSLKPREGHNWQIEKCCLFHRHSTSGFDDERTNKSLCFIEKENENTMRCTWDLWPLVRHPVDWEHPPTGRPFQIRNALLTEIQRQKDEGMKWSLDPIKCKPESLLSHDSMIVECLEGTKSQMDWSWMVSEILKRNHIDRWFGEWDFGLHLIGSGNDFTHSLFCSWNSPVNTFLIGNGCQIGGFSESTFLPIKDRQYSEGFHDGITSV
jgi:hypothetical protein